MLKTLRVSEPETSVIVNVSAASGSIPTMSTMSTTPSATVNVNGDVFENDGVSLTSIRLIVIVALSLRFVGAPSSVADTVSVKLGVNSKSSSDELATVISPLFSLIAKALFVLPETIAYFNVVPASGSLAFTVPTGVASAAFSATENVASSATGVSLTFRTLTTIS